MSEENNNKVKSINEYLKLFFSVVAFIGIVGGAIAPIVWSKIDTRIDTRIEKSIKTELKSFGSNLENISETQDKIIQDSNYMKFILIENIPKKDLEEIDKKFKYYQKNRLRK